VTLSIVPSSPVRSVQFDNAKASRGKIIKFGTYTHQKLLISLESNINVCSYVFLAKEKQTLKDYTCIKDIPGYQKNTLQPTIKFVRW
jgi:hypothetical protein